ncbi:hypothetical protein PSV09DRAFT_2388453 [Bipolaris maydis]|nr:hypothetical protein J3E74DRAFT_467902 [Bipolaris maydis]KAJ6212499.1 hypothetical protein PSV09DRAFT_2388453 [Bipolaris maydis]
MALDSTAVPGASPTSNPSNTQPASGSLSRQTSTPASRRASQISPMGPPPLPLASPGGTVPAAASAHPHTHAFPPLSPGSASYMHPNPAADDASSVPMRHPRPMTAAELHLELEKEQEAVVNRLTRELSALRAHSASVASTASLSSSAADSSIAHVDGLVTPGSMHPTSSRRHRSSSSVSRGANHAAPHRYSVSSQQTGGGTSRYEEVAAQKAELEEVKRENEGLKERIRELERLIREGAAAPTTKSSSLAEKSGIHPSSLSLTPTAPSN